MHTVSDVGAVVEWLQEHIEFGQDSTENLAVLHNQNHMVHEFGLSAWVKQSKRFFFLLHSRASDQALSVIEV